MKAARLKCLTHYRLNLITEHRKLCRFGENDCAKRICTEIIEKRFGEQKKTRNNDSLDTNRRPLMLCLITTIKARKKIGTSNRGASIVVDSYDSFNAEYVPKCTAQDQPNGYGCMRERAC